MTAWDSIFVLLPSSVGASKYYKRGNEENVVILFDLAYFHRKMKNKRGHILNFRFFRSVIHCCRIFIKFTISLSNTIF